MRNSTPPFSYRRSMRLRGYDYRRSGVYFVTLCTHEKRKLFGRIIDGEMCLRKLGELTRDEWQRIAESRGRVHLDNYVVMPNHFHGLLTIEDKHDSRIANGVPAIESKRSVMMQAGSLGAIISQFKAAVSRRAWSGLIGRGQLIWQRNYFDHIVRDEESLNEIRRYIIENPARWHDDSLYVD